MLIQQLVVVWRRIGTGTMRVRDRVVAVKMDGFYGDLATDRGFKTYLHKNK